MIIESSKTHTIIFPYRENSGKLCRQRIQPGNNEVEDAVWKTIQDAFKDRPSLFKGIKTKKESKK